MTFFTADLCDQYNDRVSLLGPGYRNYGGADKFEGEIVTMKLDRANTDLVNLLRDVDGTGKVVVVDSDQAYFAIVGEMLMKFSEQNHYAGIVLNGYVRDTVQIADIPVGLYAFGTCSWKYMQPIAGEQSVPLNFGGVEFKPGAYLYADADGVIVTDEKIV